MDYRILGPLEAYDREDSSRSAARGSAPSWPSCSYTETRR